MNDTTAISTAEKAAQQATATTAPPTAPEKAPVVKKAVQAPVKKPVAKKAAPAKPVAKAPAAPRPAPVPKIDLTPSIIKMHFGLIVTLDLTNDLSDHDEVLRKRLSKFQVEGSEHVNNLYNPFRAVTAKSKLKDPTLARGLVRNAMTTVLGIAGELDSNNLAYIGGRDAIVQQLAATAEAFKARVETSLGIAPETVIYSDAVAEGEVEQPDAFKLTLRDLVRVEAWANTSIKNVVLAEGEGEDITTNVFVNLRVTAPNLSSVEELDSAVLQIKNFLTASADKASVAVPVLFAINLRPGSLGDRRILDMLVTANEDGWDVYDRAELVAGGDSGEADWLPTGEEVNNKLLAENGDILLMTVLGQEEEAGDAEPAAE